MKRAGAGFAWFVCFWMSMLAVGGAIFGAIAGSRVGGFVGGFEAGQAAGEAFGEQFGGLVMVSALAVSVVGTLRGWLPGTRKRVVAA